ncbi:hypothetical protein GCM10027360_64520 [Amycolatopsis echigonensis]
MTVISSHSLPKKGLRLAAGGRAAWEYPAHLYLKRAKSDQVATQNAVRARPADLPRTSGKEAAC